MGRISKTKINRAEWAKKMNESRKTKKTDENREQIETSQETPAKEPIKNYSNEHIFVEIGALQLLMCGEEKKYKSLSLSLCKKSVFLFLSTPHHILHLNRV